MDNNTDIEYWKEMIKHNVDYIIEGILIPAFGSIGIFGNILSILILTFRDLDMLKSFQYLLILLCYFDLTFIVFVIVFYTIPLHSLYFKTVVMPYAVPYLLPMIHIALTGSVYSIVGIAIDRYHIVCDPQMSRNSNTKNSKTRGIVCAVIIVGFSIVYNVNKFFELETVYSENEDVSVRSTSLRSDPIYTCYVVFANFFFMLAIPAIVMSASHYLTYKVIANTSRRRFFETWRHRRRDNTMAVLFATIIVLFLICHSVKLIINLFEVTVTIVYGVEEGTSYWPLWIHVLTKVNHFLLVFNSSVNLFIYCFRDIKFQGELLTLLSIKRGRDQKMISTGQESKL